MRVFQGSVADWVHQCFGIEGVTDKTERTHRFLEEAIELSQALGGTREEAIQLVDYVYGRPKGEPNKEVGGVMITLAALCNANDLNIEDECQKELSRIWGKIEKIREKRNARPKNSPLPGQTK